MHVIYNEVDHRSILIRMLVAPLSHMISTEEMIKAILKHFLEVDLPGASFKGFGLGRRRFPTDLQQIDTRRQYKAFEMHTIYMIWKVAGTEPSSEPCSSTLPSWLNSRRRLVFIEHTFINREAAAKVSRCITFLLVEVSHRRKKTRQHSLLPSNNSISFAHVLKVFH